MGFADAGTLDNLAVTAPYLTEPPPNCASAFLNGKSCCVFCVAEVPDHGLMGFADGGTLDNLAVMPLLRRGVRCLVVFMAGATPPDDTWEKFAEGMSLGHLNVAWPLSDASWRCHVCNWAPQVAA